MVSVQVPSNLNLAGSPDHLNLISKSVLQANLNSNQNIPKINKTNSMQFKLLYKNLQMKANDNSKI